ncbi:hypothetical protein VTH06DRAFT_8244 [Thermothelomyces fergusii]
MHSSTRHQAQKGTDSSAMELALHASDLLLSSTLLQDQMPQMQDTQPELSSPQLHVDETSRPVPLMHFPHCRLDITTISSPMGSGKCEQIALPGSLVRTLLSRFDGHFRQRQQRQQYTPPSSAQPSQQQQQSQQQHQLQPPAARSSNYRPGPGGQERKKKGNKEHRTTATTTTAAAAAAASAAPTTCHPRKASRRPPIIRIQPHIDDADDWVFSRCLLADFTGFREEDAEALSSQGRLCCWASVVLERQQPPPQPRQRRRRQPPPQLQGQARRHAGCGEGREEEGGQDGGLHRGRDIAAPGGGKQAAGDLEAEGGGIRHGNGVDDNDVCVGRHRTGLEDEEWQEEEEEEEVMWELKFIVQRVGVRDPKSGWCECF